MTCPCVVQWALAAHESRYVTMMLLHIAELTRTGDVELVTGERYWVDLLFGKVSDSDLPARRRTVRRCNAALADIEGVRLHTKTHRTAPVRASTTFTNGHTPYCTQGMPL